LRKSGHSFALLKKELSELGYSNEVISLCTQKGVFPYDYISAQSKLNETELPAIEDFYNKLRESHITEEEYERAKNLFRLAKCKSIRDYMVVYLLTDVLLLAEVFVNFRETMSRQYKLDPAQFTTISAYAESVALYTSKIKLDLITDIELYFLFESQIRGGLTIVNEGYAEFNTPSLKSYDPSKECSSSAFIDVNSLYAGVLCGKLPTGGIYELTPDEVSTFDYINVDTNGDYAFAVMVDMTIPDHVKKMTDDLPLGIGKMTPEAQRLSPFTLGNMEKIGMSTRKMHPKLMATHNEQKDYLITLQQLQLFVELGAKITKLKRVIRFNQSACFEKFIEKNIELRKASSNDFEKSLYKIVSNSLFGKLLFNCRKNSQQVKVVSTRERFLKLACNPLLKNTHVIEGDKIMMTFTKSDIKLNSPLYIGWFILELSKNFMYKFFYHTLKAHYGENVSLMYMDTDSLFLRFRKYDALTEMGKFPLKPHMDRSNFDKNHPLYDVSNKGMLGKWKSEVGSNTIKNACFLAPKLYSIQIDNATVKSAAKGVPFSRQKNLRHELYLAIHRNEKTEETVKMVNITCRKSKIYTMQTVKRGLCKVDQKRYWVNNTFSLGFGHPDIEQYASHEGRTPQSADCEDTVLSPGRHSNTRGIGLTDDISDNHVVTRVEESSDDENDSEVQTNFSLREPYTRLNLTHRRSKAGREVFNID